MKDKQIYFRLASFGALFFVILGYAIKFYPEQLQGFDSSIQTAVRGHLPAGATSFFTSITVLGNPLPVLFMTLVAAASCYGKKWRMESYFLVASFVSIAVFSTAFKFIYQRPRPTIEWLVDTTGYSFPSWHTASTLMIAGALVIICQQRMKAGVARLLCQILLVATALLVGLSRIYVGVHFPTDILGGWLLALTLLAMLYPFYDQWRFIWRFQGKQK